MAASAHQRQVFSLNGGDFRGQDKSHHNTSYNYGSINNHYGPQFNLSESLQKERLDFLSNCLLVSKQAEYDAALSEGTAKRVPCVPRTRERVLQELDEWRNDIEAPLVYWMNGMAGTGKTTISYSFCDAAGKKSSLGASFFCTRTRQDCRDVNTIFPNIAYQLARASSAFRDVLEPMLRNDPDLGHRNVTQQFARLIICPLLLAIDHFHRSNLIVIDGIDECSNPDATCIIFRTISSLQGTIPKEIFFQMPPSFRKIYEYEDYEYDENDPRKNKTIIKYNIPTIQSVIPVKIYIASRPDPRAELELHQRISLFRLHEIQQFVVQSDIEEFLRQSLSKHASSEQIRILAEQASNLFIYAATAVRYLTDPRAFNPHDRLQRMLQISQIRNNSAKSSEELDQLYHLILEFALHSEDLEEAEKVDRRGIFDAVVFSLSPMTISAHADLFGLPEDTVELALYPVHSIIHVSTIEKPVSPLHASLADYLSNPQRSLEQHCKLSQFHLCQAIRCVRVLVTQYKQGCALSALSVSEQLRAFKWAAHTKECVRYASRYWIEHLVNSNPMDVSQEGVELIHELLTKYCGPWLQSLVEQRCAEIGRLTRGLRNWMPLGTKYFVLRQEISRIRKQLSSLQCHQFCCFGVFAMVAGNDAVAAVCEGHRHPEGAVEQDFQTELEVATPTHADPSVYSINFACTSINWSALPPTLRLSTRKASGPSDLRLLGEGRRLFVRSGTRVEIWSTTMHWATPLFSSDAEVFTISPDGRFFAAVGDVFTDWSVTYTPRTVYFRATEIRIWHIFNVREPLNSSIYALAGWTQNHLVKTTLVVRNPSSEAIVITSLLFSPNSIFIAFIANPDSVGIGIWKRHQVSELHQIRGSYVGLYSFSPTGRLLLCFGRATKDHVSLVVLEKCSDTPSIKEIAAFVFRGSHKDLDSCAHLFSPGEQNLFFMSSPRVLHLWSIETGHSIREFDLDYVYKCIAFLPHLPMDSRLRKVQNCKKSGKIPVLAVQGDWTFVLGSQVPCVYWVLCPKAPLKIWDTFGSMVCYSIGNTCMVANLRLPITTSANILHLPAGHQEFTRRAFKDDLAYRKG